MKKKRFSKNWKWAIQGLPLAAASASTFFPLQRFLQQLIMLVVLLWIQVFFILECFLSGR